MIASIAALAGIAEQEAGAASGTNTAAFQIGGATGAAIVTTVAATQGNGTAAALTDGCQMAFAACAGFAIIGLTAAFLLKTRCATRAIAAPEKLSEPPPERACSPSAGLSRPSLTQETAPCSVTIPSTSSSRSAT